MFGPRYFGHRYYGPRYFGDGGSGAPAPSAFEKLVTIDELNRIVEVLGGFLIFLPGLWFDARI
ncbi:hypothetical protein LCGC14_2981590 [marine sediment metagenome]|uniref:Uncharacterized protein n=1 Tax=marine sediment metagenome TaxID=412755 RepID=A0A0F8X6D3_9ZZZZ